MTDGIDWAAIEQARAKLSAKPEMPSGWINAQMYADKFGMTRDGAGNLWRAMVTKGLMESAKNGRGLIYRPHGKIHA